MINFNQFNHFKQAMKNDHDNSSMRLDKWLWAARFFKTRALAQKHIELGRVLVNGSKVKNSKNISAGDTIDMTLTPYPTIQSYRTQSSTPPGTGSAFTLRRRHENGRRTRAQNSSTKPAASVPLIRTDAQPNATAASLTV